MSEGRPAKGRPLANGSGKVIQLRKRQVICDRPEWAYLAQLLAYRLEDHREVEFFGVLEEAPFEDGTAQHKAPYAGFKSRRRAANGSRAQVLVPFDPKRLRQNPRAADEIAQAAGSKIREMFAEAREDGKIDAV
jgi:hypothetical protein